MPLRRLVGFVPGPGGSADHGSVVSEPMARFDCFGGSCAALVSGAYPCFERPARSSMATTGCGDAAEAMLGLKASLDRAEEPRGLTIIVQPTWTNPSACANPAASTRRLAPSFRRMFETWTPAVLGLM